MLASPTPHLGDALGMSASPIRSPAGMAVCLKSLFFKFSSDSGRGFQVIGFVCVVDVRYDLVGRGLPKIA